MVVGPATSQSRERTVSTHVLLEGVSDVAALRALAATRGLDLHGVLLLDLQGVTNVRRALHARHQLDPGAEVLGLCDAAEVDVVIRALASLDRPVRDASDLPSHGFFVCRADLEEELLRAVGTARALEVVDQLGLSGKLAGLQQQPAWQDRPLEQQLHRFCGVAAGRKQLLAARLAAALGPDEVPEPLHLLLDRIEASLTARRP